MNTAITTGTCFCGAIAAEKFQPAAHAYWQMKLPWIHVDDSLPRIDDYSRPRDARLGSPKDRSSR